MIKKQTQERINRTIICYLNLMGIWKDNYIKDDNPILIYFMSNLLLTDRNDFLTNLLKYSDDSDDLIKIINVHISNNYFQLMINELYNVYINLENIYNNQDDVLKSILSQLIGQNSLDINEYISFIFVDFKDSFYELVRYYNSKNERFNEIKIKVLTDKMYEFAKLEDYEEAAILRDKINDLKQKMEV